MEADIQEHKRKRLVRLVVYAVCICLFFFVSVAWQSYLLKKKTQVIQISEETPISEEEETDPEVLRKLEILRQMSEQNGAGISVEEKSDILKSMQSNTTTIESENSTSTPSPFPL